MIFVDTSFFIAISQPRDLFHSRALQYAQLREPLLTTEYVLCEVMNALCRIPDRNKAIAMARTMTGGHDFTFVQASQDWLREGLLLFEQRPDKEWSMTDCISMRVIHKYQVQDVLTSDHHFEQAGFQILLKL